MTTCTATLTTATVTNEVKTSRVPLGMDGVFYADRIHDGWTVKRDGDRLLKVELHTLTCESRHNNPNEMVELHYWMSDISQVKWDDDTPGATPHTPTSTVTDAEFKAAVSAFNAHLDVHRGAYNAALDGALVAAAAVRAAQEDGR